MFVNSFRFVYCMVSRLTRPTECSLENPSQHAARTMLKWLLKQIFRLSRAVLVDLVDRERAFNFKFALSHQVERLLTAN